MKLTKNGFITLDGTFICLKPQEHRTYLMKSTSKENDFNWIKLSYSMIGILIHLEGTYDIIEPTQAQIDTLFDWAKKFNFMDEYNEFLERYE